MTDCLTRPTIPEAVHSLNRTMNSDSKQYVLVV